MNTYDPANYIVYVSMDRTFPASGMPAAAAATAHRLPSGYANGSPLTRLRRTAQAGSAHPSVALVLGGSA
jgi:hypothetical protein